MYVCWILSHVKRNILGIFNEPTFQTKFGSSRLLIYGLRIEMASISPSKAKAKPSMLVNEENPVVKEEADWDS